MKNKTASTTSQMDIYRDRSASAVFSLTFSVYRDIYVLIGSY